MRPATVRLVVAVLVLALVLGGLGVALSVLVGGDGSGGRSGSWTPAPTGTADEGAHDPPTPELARYYDQEPDWAPCEGSDRLECATLEVPVDYADPDGETIEIALLKDPADEPRRRIGSLVVNPGGPGVPGTTYAAAAADQFGSALTDRFDVVGFDPRGTGSSAPVDCLSDADLDALLAFDPSPDTPEEVRETERWSARVARGCADSEPSGISRHVSTQEAARDMDVLRAALGESTLDYLGASYGTVLGATYAELFADRVGRMVLDGGVDVSLDTREASLGQARGFETALRAYVGHCVEEGDCFLGDDVESGLRRIRALLDQVDEEPLPAGDRPLTSGLAVLGLITPLYVRDYWPLLDRALQAAFDGDGTVLRMLADAYSSRGEDGYADNSSEAIIAINCLDDPSTVAPGQVPALVPEFLEASPTLGDVFAWGLTSCAGFPRDGAPPLEIDGEGAAPILVVGTTRDPATPYEWSVALAEQLDSGVLLTRDGDGHTGYASGNECVDEIVEGYLIDGTVPDDGARC